VPHAPDGGARGVGIHVEAADPDDLAGDARDEQRLARLVEAIGAGGPVLDESPDEAETVSLALRDERAETLWRRLDQRLDPRPATERDGGGGDPAGAVERGQRDLDDGELGGRLPPCPDPTVVARPTPGRPLPPAGTAWRDARGAGPGQRP
jgi:hypothetical protein